MAKKEGKETDKLNLKASFLLTLPFNIKITRCALK